MTEIYILNMQWAQRKCMSRNHPVTNKKESKKIYYLHVSHPALSVSVGPVDSSQPMLLPSTKYHGHSINKLVKKSVFFTSSLYQLSRNNKENKLRRQMQWCNNTYHTLLRPLVAFQPSFSPFFTFPFNFLKLSRWWSSFKP